MKQFKLVSLGLLLISSMAMEAQIGALKGQVLNDDHLPVIGATIQILQGGSLVGGTATDVDGRYTYKPLTPGNYDLLVSSMETQTKKITNVRVSGEKTTFVDVAVATNTLVEVVIEEHIKPIIDNTYMHIKEINAGDFQVLAIDRGNIVDAVLAISSEASQDSNGDLHVRGSRGDATAYYVDGVRSPGITGVAALSVENVSVITGGIPAQYGDVTSGVIIVTTKDYFGGIQSKRMRDSYITENKERIKREKSALAEEKKRKKEIEEELRLEEEAKKKNGTNGQ
jgi:hypothetical protein